MTASLLWQGVAGLKPPRQCCCYWSEKKEADITPPPTHTHTHTHTHQTSLYVVFGPPPPLPLPPTLSSVTPVCQHQVCVCVVSVGTMLNGRYLLPLRLHVSGVNCTSVAYVHLCVCVWVCMCVWGWRRMGGLVEGLRRTSPTLAGGKSIIISFPGERCSEHEPSTSFYPSCPIAYLSIIHTLEWVCACVCVCVYSTYLHSCNFIQNWRVPPTILHNTCTVYNLTTGCPLKMRYLRF